MSELLDERALRRPDFRGGLLLTLADGQDWTIPQPNPLWVADDTEDGATLGFDLGPEYDALARNVVDATLVGPMARATLKAATFLLRLNYTLDAAALGTILRANFAVPAEGVATTPAQQLAQDLVEIVTGNAPAPKASRDGSESP